MNFDDLFKQIVLLSLTGSILSIAILLIKNIFRKKLSAKVHYFIWFLLVLKLIVPLNYQSEINPFNYININRQNINAPYSITQKITGPAESSVSTNVKSSNASAVKDAPKTDNYKKAAGFEFNLNTAAEIWCAGVLLFLLYIVFINIMLNIKIKRSSRCKRQVVNDILHEAELQLGINSKVTLVYDKNLKSPSVYGIIHPKILISESVIDKLSQQELKFVFMHELNHIKRKDLLLNMVILLLKAVYWFNPLIVYSLSQFKQDCELACDEDTIAALNSNEVLGYGKTIISMLQIVSKPNLSVGALGFSNKFNKRRIIMISLFNKKSIVATVMALSLLLAASCSIAPNKPNAKSAASSQTTADNSESTNQSESNKQGQTSTSNNSSASKASTPSSSTAQADNNISQKVKDYILNGQGDKPEAQKLHWSERFLNNVDINSLYKKYTAGGGKADDVQKFAEYITLNAPIQSNWQDMFKKDLYDSYGQTVVKLEPLGGDMYQAYVKINGSVVPYVGVSARTGYFHG